MAQGLGDATMHACRKRGFPAPPGVWATDVIFVIRAGQQRAPCATHDMTNVIQLRRSVTDTSKISRSHARDVSGIGDAHSAGAEQLADTSAGQLPIRRPRRVQLSQEGREIGEPHAIFTENRVEVLQQLLCFIRWDCGGLRLWSRAAAGTRHQRGSVEQSLGSFERYVKPCEGSLHPCDLAGQPICVLTRKSTSQALRFALHVADLLDRILSPPSAGRAGPDGCQEDRVWHTDRVPTVMQRLLFDDRRNLSLRCCNSVGIPLQRLTVDIGPPRLEPHVRFQASARLVADADVEQPTINVIETIERGSFPIPIFHVGNSTTNPSLAT